MRYLPALWILVVKLCLPSSALTLVLPHAEALPKANTKALLNAEPAGTQQPQISLSELRQAIFKNLHRVREFKALAEHAQKLDIQGVYLFGGTAAAFAHHVRRDLEHQHTASTATFKSDAPFDTTAAAPTPTPTPTETETATATAMKSEKLNYTLWSILFQNQDVDIVVDTQESQKIQQLKEAMKKEFSLHDRKWDFEGLHVDYAGRPALLTSPDFAHQHTDAHSISLLPIPFAGQSKPLTLKYHFRNKTDTFLTDVIKQKLSCYHSPKHRETPRYQQGNNPEIFFAIRVLIKAFQYGLSVPDDCMAKIQHIFKNFKADRDLKTGYSQHWIEKNAKKLYTTSIDLERSQRILQQLGALKILQNLKRNAGKTSSMAWWLNRQPLLSRPILSPPTDPAHTTAQQLGLRYVAHSTRTPEAYESITRSHDLRPNVLLGSHSISDDHDGFFTAPVNGPDTCSHSNSGIYGPFGICFRVHPHARQGVDFIVLEGPKHVIFKNKSALTIVNSSASKANEYFNAWLQTFQQGGDINKQVQNISADIQGLIPFILNQHPDKQDEFIQSILNFSKSLSLQKYVHFWSHTLHLLPPKYVAHHYEKFLPSNFKQTLRHVSENKIDATVKQEFPAFLNLFGLLYNHIKDHDSDLKSLWNNEVFGTSLKKFSDHLNAREHIVFWNGLHYFFSSRIHKNLYHEQLWGLKMESLIHTLSETQIDPQAEELISQLLDYIDKFYSHFNTDVYDIANLWHNKAFIKILLKYSAGFDAEQHFLFWRNHLKRLPLFYVAQHYEKFLPPKHKQIMTNYLASVGKSNELHADPNRAGPNNESTHLNHNNHLTHNMNFLLASIEAISIAAQNKTLGPYGKSFKPLWIWFLNQLLVKLESLNLHALSKTRIDSTFEALLVRAVLEATYGSAELLEDEDRFFRQAIGKVPTVALPPDVFVRFDNLVVNNIDYFIKHNNILISRYLTGYILQHPKMPPQKKALMLAKIIRHEAESRTKGLPSDYVVKVGSNNAHGKIDYALDYKITVAAKATYYSFYQIPRVAVAKFKESSVADVVAAIYNFSPGTEELWSNLKGSESLFKTIYQSTDSYTSWMVNILMRRHWARQRGRLNWRHLTRPHWALDLVERMLDDAIKKNRINTNQEKKTHLMAQPRPIDSLLNVLYIFTDSLGLQSNPYYYTGGSNAYMRYTASSFQYDHQYLRAHPTALRILEKVILATANHKPRLTNARLPPTLQRHFANMYFDGKTDFILPQLFQKIRQARAPNQCLQRLNN